MKRLFVFFVVCQIAVAALCQSSKVVYSNASTHFYLTCIVYDTAHVYTISESSVPAKNVWRMSDRTETQVLRTFTPLECRDFLELLEDFARRAVLDDYADYKEIEIDKLRDLVVPYIQLRNKNSGVQFNVNKKTAIKALESFREYEYTHFNSDNLWQKPK